MDCPTCRTENPAGAKHCQECGAPLLAGPLDETAKFGQSPSEQLIVGQLTKAFSGKYRIERKLGSGGMAEIYEGRHQALGSSVAIKVLSSPFNRDDDMVRRFFREARSAAGLKHPNIINIQDVGQADDVHYLVMDYVDGRDLKGFIKDHPNVDVIRAIDIIAQVARALAYAHSRGVVHRDIKPANIMIDRHGTALVMDFGIAKVRDATTQLTQQGSLIGTPRYMSPEQCKGEEVTKQSDIYSLGVVFYQLLAGRVPFEGNESLSILYQHINTQPPPLGELRRDLPLALTHIVGRMIEKDLSRRYPDADTLLEDLEKLRSELHAGRSKATSSPGVTSAPTAASAELTIPMPSLAPTLSPKKIQPAQEAAKATHSSGQSAPSASAPTRSPASLTPPPAVPAMEQSPHASTPSPRPPDRSASLPPTAQRKKSRAPAVIVALLILGGGGVAAWYFLNSSQWLPGGSRARGSTGAELSATNSPSSRTQPETQAAEPKSDSPSAAPASENERQAQEWRNSPKRMNVKHRHAIGSCDGTLTIARGFVSYQPARDSKDFFKRAYDKMQYSGKGTRLTIQFPDHKYDFDLPSAGDLQESIEKLKQFGAK